MSTKILALPDDACSVCLVTNSNCLPQLSPMSGLSISHQFWDLVLQHSLITPVTMKILANFHLNEAGKMVPYNYVSYFVKPAYYASMRMSYKLRLLITTNWTSSKYPSTMYVWQTPPCAAWCTTTQEAVISCVHPWMLSVDYCMQRVRS